MPPSRRCYRTQRQFHPHTMRVCFQSERLVTPPPSPARHEFGPESTAPSLTAAVLLHSCQTIPKPNGEVTRIGRGGYNLRDALRWKEALYTQVQNTVHRLADAHLQIHTSFSKQSSQDLQTVYTLAANDYPFLTKYENNWVVADFLRVYLKNKSASTKKKTMAE
ncbi:uncharacterized protein LAESUDRAFT_658145 [Laetiporus sulphureus 93-53]|uniref:Uncharacterized protein n=1 Tax=Laetiporus sulphureus 93-53 TaxID=1314785 RepID=A0A165D6F5_9APHY|nr:uncharacterized protein LAESUDRAFT_658145 [Laetiporus sulphureus 93-53]KZT04240.1 hypothetical protein LAESUDRAFT_658145 [Laetiporus sulphureus 93-53]